MSEPVCLIYLTHAQQMSLMTILTEYIRMPGSVQVFINATYNVEVKPEELLLILMDAKFTSTQGDT